MNWSDLLAAFALYLVIEGIMPFVNPRGMRQALQSLARLEDRALRIAGLASMVVGAALLYLVRG
jgi:uncharacterized protein